MLVLIEDVAILLHHYKIYQVTEQRYGAKGLIGPQIELGLLIIDRHKSKELAQPPGQNTEHPDVVKFEMEERLGVLVSISKHLNALIRQLKSDRTGGVCATANSITMDKGQVGIIQLILN